MQALTHTTNEQTLDRAGRKLRAARSRRRLSENTRRAYDLAAAKLAGVGYATATGTDAALADALEALAAAGASPSTCKLAAAAAVKAAHVLCLPSPRGSQTQDVLGTISRDHRHRGRGQAAALTADDAAAIAAVARQPRKRGRGSESAATAVARGTLDIAIVGLLFHAGLRRSEAAALTWADVADAPNTPGAILITVASSKTNQDGSRADVRMVKNGYAAALRSLRPVADADAAKVLGGMNAATVARRLQAAAAAAGIEGRITGHSGRIGLASELVSRGASTADVMLAGGWTTARMVAHYAAGSQAERGAVARYL